MIKSFASKIYTDAASAMQYHQLWRFVCSILIGILMVKAGWDKETVAIYELLFFAAHLLSFAWSTGVNNALLAYYHTQDQDRAGDILFNAAALLFSLAVVVVILFLTFKSSILNLITDKADLPYAHWIGLYLFCSPVTVLIQSVYLLRDEPQKITRYTHIIFLLQLCIITVAVLILGTVQALVIGIVLWSVIRFIWLLAVLTSYSSGRFDNLMFKAFAWFSVPLILQFALSSGMEYVDGIIVNQYFDSQSFPIFRYGSRELPITMILVVALSSAMIPLAVKDLESTLSEIKERTKRLIHFLFPLSIILILISPYVYSLVYSEAYRASAQLFNIYLLILSSRILLPHVVMYAKQRNVALLKMSIVELIINVGLSIWWAQSMGLAGIAYATVVANVSYSLMMIGYNRYILNIPSKSYIPWKAYSFYMILLVGTFILSMQIHDYG